MSKIERIINPLKWTSALLLAVFLAGCGDSNSGSSSDDPTAGAKAVIDLGTAGNFVVLAKTAITNVTTSDITGNIGASPVTGAAIHVTCGEITGTIYGSNTAYVGSGNISCYKGDAPDNTLVANAVLDMATAYTSAAGRVSPDFTELHAGDLSAKTLTPGLYKWGTSVVINTDVTLSGNADAIWIFQIAGDLTQAAGTPRYPDGRRSSEECFLAGWRRLRRHDGCVGSFRGHYPRGKSHRSGQPGNGDRQVASGFRG